MWSLPLTRVCLFLHLVPLPFRLSRLYHPAPQITTTFPISLTIYQFFGTRPTCVTRLALVANPSPSPPFTSARLASISPLSHYNVGQHCNATGHYAGHPDPAPHLKDEQPQTTGHRKGLLSAFPRTKYDDEETWLRAAQPTDANGVAEFTSIFPGYYTGRATHVHTKIHPQWETLPNGTFISGQMAHTGQFFVPDDLNVRVDKLWPYVTNPIADIRGRTRNWADSLNIFEDSQIGGYQSMFDIQFLGGVLEQGLIGYITVVVNKSADHTVAWSVDQGKEKAHQAKVPPVDETAQASSVSSAAEQRATTGPTTGEGEKDEL